MGNPKITIQLPLYFDSNEFFICNMTKSNFGDKYFSDLKLFKNSESMKEVDEGVLEVSGYFFQLAYSYIDNFYFNNDKYSMEFYLPLETDEVLSCYTESSTIEEEGKVEYYINAGEKSTNPLIICQVEG